LTIGRIISQQHGAAQELPGHANVSTTVVYTDVMNRRALWLQRPIDRLWHRAPYLVGQPYRQRSPQPGVVPVRNLFSLEPFQAQAVAGFAL
jgi:hypothetical protein